MTWRYQISTGKLTTEDNEVIAIGYSGKGDDKNNPGAQSLRDHGPIPIGTYYIQTPVDTLTHGPFVLPLEPDAANLMWGRSGFLMHGDSVVSPGTASEGCVIMPRTVREQVWSSGDRTLTVIE